MSYLSLHDCDQGHPHCTIVRADSPGWDSHVQLDLTNPLDTLESHLNQSFPHHDFRGGKDGTSTVFGVPPVPEAVRPTPDLVALGMAIISSPSIDQATKDAIVAALKGTP
jgi:hypothetical protein